MDPPEAVIRPIGEDCPIDELIAPGLRNRPELAEAQALVQATPVRLKPARPRPFVPGLAPRYSGAGSAAAPLDSSATSPPAATPT